MPFEIGARSALALNAAVKILTADDYREPLENARNGWTGEKSDTEEVISVLFHIHNDPTIPRVVIITLKLTANGWKAASGKVAHPNTKLGIPISEWEFDEKGNPVRKTISS